MDYNIINGGLLCKAGNKLLISDLKKLNTVFNFTARGMFWFMNFDGSCVFYSDQKQNNALCRLNLERLEEKLLLNKPCYGLCLHEDWLYYISEDDRKVYRCAKNGKDDTRIIDEEVDSFILENEKLYYTNVCGIWRCNNRGGEREQVNSAVASILLLIDGKLAYTNRNKQHLLTVLELDTNRMQVFDGMAVGSLNTDGRYLYGTNRFNEGSIYRIDPATGSSIRICGESADYLHIIENELYFCLKREWHKMSLVGGQYQKV